LASDEQIQEKIPSDLCDVHTSQLLAEETDIQVSQMSITETDASTFDSILNAQQSTGEHFILFRLSLFSLVGLFTVTLGWYSVCLSSVQIGDQVS